MLNLHRVRLLVELRDRGTISAVADALHYTPSTVSEALSALEREVGVPLLERSPRSVRLTPAGDVLAAHGAELVHRLGVAHSEVLAAGHQATERLVIATFPSAGATIVAEAVAHLRAGTGELRVQVVEAEPVEALERLRRGEVDLAVVYEYGPEPELRAPGVSLEPLREEPVKVCLPPSLVPGDDSVIPLEALSECSFVAGHRGSQCHAFTTAACRAAGFEPRIDYETDDVALTCALVNLDLGVALMAQSLLDTAPTPVRIARSDLPPRRVSIAQRTGAPVTRPVRAALDALGAVC